MGWLIALNSFPLWNVVGGISGLIGILYAVVRVRRWMIRDVAKILAGIAHTLNVKPDDDEDDGDTIAAGVGAAAKNAHASSEAADRIEVFLEQRAQMDRMAENTDNLWASYLLLMEILKDQKLPERVRRLEQYAAHLETERRARTAGDLTEGGPS